MEKKQSEPTVRICMYSALLVVLLVSSASVRAQTPVQDVVPTKVGEVREYSSESRHPYRRGNEGRPVVWTDAVVSAGATFVRIHFVDFNLSAGDYVTVYDSEGAVSWTYTDQGPNGTGDFWSFAVPGDTAFIDIHAGPRRGYGYRVVELGHGTADLFPRKPKRNVITPDSICGDDGKEDVVCHPDINNAPVAKIVFVTSGGGMASCTSWLVTGSNSNTMITNNHCISDQSGTSSVQAIFNFQHTTCGGTGNATTSSFAGGTFLKTNPVNGGLDYTLFTVQGNPEATFGKLVPAASNSPAGTQIHIIGHAGGRAKQISFFENAAHTIRCALTAVNQGGGTQAEYTCDTEGGSSGSPVFNTSTGQVIALHHFGGCANAGTQIAQICADAGSLLQCGANPRDFRIAASPTAVTVTQGASASSTVTVSSLNGFNSATTLSASGLPGGVTASFSSNPVTPPANGSANSTLTFTASSTAATGTFTVTVSGSSGSLSHSTSLTLTVAGAAGGELVVNGGFENGTAPWTLTGGAGIGTTFPHTGADYLFLNGVNSSTDSAFQQITIPSGASRNLNFWLNVTTNETTTTTQFDKLFIEVRSTSGALLTTLATFSNLNGGASGAYSLKGPFSLASFSGQTIRIQFRGTSDSSLTTRFRIDDVSAK